MCSSASVAIIRLVEQPVEFRAGKLLQVQVVGEEHGHRQIELVFQRAHLVGELHVHHRRQQANPKLVVLQRVIVEVAPDAAGDRQHFLVAGRMLGQEALVESADALRVVPVLDLFGGLAVESTGDPRGDRDRAQHDFRLDVRDVHEKTP
ncbi:uncharacterized protein YqfB (UPF0267 family) [Paraburkholderia youngii]